MWVAECPRQCAAVALAGAIAVAPIAPRLPEMPLVSTATRLLADDSILNIPLNLFYDLVNIPYNELEAVEFSARSLFNSGPWFAVSPTNLWGVDPGDPSHFQTVINLLAPFPALSGMESPELDFDAGLGQQIWGLNLSQLPLNAACAAGSCIPPVPTSPITGITSIDELIWGGQVFTGAEKFPLFETWFRTPLGDLNNYTFGADGNTPADDPSGVVYPLPADGIFNLPEIPGTGPDYDGVGTQLPWIGDTYTLNLIQPFENFFNSLMATPPTDGIFDTGIEIPTFDQIGRTLQALLAGYMFFDPFTPGSPFCPGDCSIVTDLHLDYPDLIKDIGNIWPGNPLIDEWESMLADGTANVPSDEINERSVDILQQGFWDFNDPSPPADWSRIGVDSYAVAQLFHQLWTDLGLNVPPLGPQLTDAEADVGTLLGGASANSLAGDDPATDFFSNLWTELTSPADWASLL